MLLNRAPVSVPESLFISSSLLIFDSLCFFIRASVSLSESLFTLRSLLSFENLANTFDLMHVHFKASQKNKSDHMHVHFPVLTEFESS